MADRKFETVRRWVPTCINRDGVRTLIGPAQGRYTYATREEAQSYCEAVSSVNSHDAIAQVWGQQALGTFEPREVECYAGHFDPTRIYFEE